MNTVNCSPRHRMNRGLAFGSWPLYFEDMMNGKDFATHVPSVNVIENENDWKIEVAAPGFAKEDFKVNLEKEVLTISAEHKAEAEKAEKNYTRREFSFGSFTRSFKVKENSIDIPKISAAYENGVLNIVLPKLIAEPKRGVTIDIK